MKFFRQLRPCRKFVGGSAIGQQASLRIPNQLFQSKPAQALDKPALHLAHIHLRGERFAHVMQDVYAQHAVLAGKTVYLHFTYGCSIGKVIEWLPLHGRGIVVDLRRAVIALRKQGNALAISSLNDGSKGQTLAAGANLPIGKVHVGSIPAEQRCCHGRKAGF